MPDRFSVVFFVYLRQPVQLSVDELRGAWAQLWPQEQPPAFSGGGGAVSWSRGSDGGFGTFRDMGGPIPLRHDPDQPLGSWLWRDAQQSLDGHGSCVIGLVRELQPYAAMQLATRVTAAVVSATSALGAQLQTAGPLVAAERFLRLAQSEVLQVMLWVDLPCWPRDGGMALATDGLRQFGGMEVEIPSSPLPCNELRLWVAQVVSYLIENRPLIVRDGDTVGWTADERVRVTYARSLVRQGELVYQMPGP